MTQNSLDFRKKYYFRYVVTLFIIVCANNFGFVFGTTGKICNSFNPNCKLSPLQARIKYLTPYLKLLPKLQLIKTRSKVPVKIGPLIKQSPSKWGIFNIDTPLDLTLSATVNVSICGQGTTPSIREAVICSVTNDQIIQPPVGNVDGTKIGKSNQGRFIYAARLGKKGGVRVLITTQLHGNEAAGTEAAFSLLTSLTRDMKFAKPLLKRLDIVIVFRVNPDAGEPSGKFPSFGVPFTDSFAFHRQNIDPTAGGGFQRATETGFFGVVGRGYDLNRYNYAGFQEAVRPVESQALVAALHSFRPSYVYDLHGDLPKVVCEPNLQSVKPGAVLGIAPSFECLPPAPPVPSLNTSRGNMVVATFFGDDSSILEDPGRTYLTSLASYPRSVRETRSVLGIINARLKNRIDGFMTRYSFPSSAGNGSALFSDGTFDRGAMRLGAVGSGWEVLNFVPQLRPAVNAISITPDGQINPSVAGDSTDVEACFLQDNICLHNEILRKTLQAVNRLSAKKRVLGDNGFCNIPTDDGVISDFPAENGFLQFSTDGPVMIPQAGKLGVPSEISGICAGDLV